MKDKSDNGQWEPLVMTTTTTAAEIEAEIKRLDREHRIELKHLRALFRVLVDREKEAE